MSSADAQTKTGIEAVQAGGDAMLGMAAFGKTALVLVAMVGFILLCGWLLKRFGPGQTAEAFDSVTSMFALHYFFASETSLRH
ncbi:MAG: hypothetical protein ACPG6O_10285, partial [Alloalcanivorax venustensis]